MTDQTDQTEDPMREFARSLFAPDPDEPDPDEPAPPDPATANHVPGEGNNPTEPGHDLHAWVEALFTNHD